MTHGAVEEPKVRKLPTPSHYRSPTLSQSVRGSCHTPAAVSRWSKICLIDSPRQCVCKHRHDRIPNVSKLPAPSRHRALTPSQTARVSRRSPIIVSGWSKICIIDRPRQVVCKRRCERIPKVGKLPRAVAPSRSDTLADGAWQPAQPHLRFSMVENVSHRTTAPTCVQASVCDWIPKVGKLPLAVVPSP